MSIDTLSQILPPPDHPKEIPNGQHWEDVRNVLAPPPEDYIKFLTIYGTGCIDDFLWILNPASSNENLNLLKQLERQRIAFKDVFDISVNAPNPCGILQRDFFFPFGITDNGDVLFWQSKGVPQNWAVSVIDSRSLDLNTYNLRMTDFLALLITGKITVPNFPSDFPSESPKFFQVGI